MRFIFFLCICFSWIPGQAFAESVSLMDNDDKIETIELEDYALKMIDPIFIDEKKVEFLEEYIASIIYEKPENAYLDEVGNIIEGQKGVTLDQNRFQMELWKRFYTRNSNQIKIPTKPIKPRIHATLLDEITTNKLSTYTTKYREQNQERSHNVKLATEAINNYVLFPKETFSFNKVVGKRTEEKGYKRAPVIVKGELAEDIGGGICQVSSTLFNAVDLEGIEIVERYSHSRDVPYVPPGKDATVSWYGPDFVFTNMYNEPIFIRAIAKNGNLQVDIYSSRSIQTKSN
ncbi:VanW family protein [Oceanobacillus halotolerans]|uniref:VanW family protein n=1 Tax=Oceanobacillus halotolerans TaxID=2663380 RepID=UPI0013DCF8E6|nr:VanW family protein [Oceanobacillus halotolerans]